MINRDILECGKCLWWDSEHDRVPIVGAGFCRKHKPAGQNKAGELWGVWPLTDKNDFCGEFKERV